MYINKYIYIYQQWRIWDCYSYNIFAYLEGNHNRCVYVPTKSRILESGESTLQSQLDWFD